MKKNININILFGLSLFAAFLGLFAQSIARFFESRLFYMDSLKMLIIVTISSISLFILVFFIQLILLTVRKLKPKRFMALLITNGVMGVLVSIWSIFVLNMWWG